MRSTLRSNSKPAAPRCLAACSRFGLQQALQLLLLLLLLGMPGVVLAQEHAPAVHGQPAPTKKTSDDAPQTAKQIGDQVREAVDNGAGIKKGMTLTINGKDKNLIAMPHTATASRQMAAAPRTGTAMLGPAAVPVPMHMPPGALPNPATSRQYIRARAAAMAGNDAAAPVADAHAATGDVHWSYEGTNGPQAWSQLKPDFSMCASGKRQSPINIEESATLRGPAEAIQFDLSPSSGSVLNNGHTIQVDVLGENSITVRGSNFRLLQFHFHHPSEERVNSQSFAMVAHLVHRNVDGQLAVVAVLLEPGAANPLINKVWTYMPLDAGDRVRMPPGSLQLAELLPKDQRYYQFMGSLTTPPCSEGVLWMVLKQPVTLSREQLRLFAQLFPNNARPVQQANGRAIRDAQ